MEERRLFGRGLKLRRALMTEMKKWRRIWLAAACSVLISQAAFGAGWRQEESAGGQRWRYENEEGGCAAFGWYWLDGV